MFLSKFHLVHAIGWNDLVKQQVEFLRDIIKQHSKEEKKQQRQNKYLKYPCQYDRFDNMQVGSSWNHN